MAPAASGGRSQSRGLARPPTPASGWPVPVLARRRHEIGEPVEKLKRREVDDAIGPRPRGLARAARPDPVGGPNGDPVSGQHVADAGDLAVCTADHGQSLQRERRPGTVSQQVFEALKIARHVAVY